MVIDTSAIVAILWQEPEASRLAASIESDPIRLISAVNWLETQMVLRGRSGAPGALLAEAFFRERKIEIVPVDAVIAQLGLTAWERFGKGNHSAGLNLGDCFAYATAVVMGRPLLFKGGEFSRTDVSAVAY